MRARPAVLAGLAAAAAFLVFSPSFSHGWVGLDDPMFLLGRTEWRGLGLSAWRWAFTAKVASVYQPLAWLSYGLDYVLWGLDPRGYHLQSAFWHALAAGFFFLAARRLLAAARQGHAGEPEWGLDAAALLAALVFAVHPLRVESVAWASERRDVVCGALFNASLLAYLRARQPGRRPLSLASSAVLFALALLAKGMALTLPAVLLVLDAYPLRRLGPRGEGWREALREKIPFFALSTAFALIGLMIQYRMRWSWVQHGPASRLAQSAYAALFYVRKTIWPSGLAAMYELRPPLDPLEPRFLSALLLVTAAAWLCLRWRRKRPWAAAAAGAYALLLAPVCGLFQFGPQLVADRYSYLPALPFAVLAGAAFRQAVARRPRATAAAAAALVVVLAAATVRQQDYWRGTEELWTRVLLVDPDSGPAHLGLGVLRGMQGRLDEAERHFLGVLESRPGCVSDQDRLARLLSSGGGDPDETARLRVVVEEGVVCRKARADLGAVLAQRGDLPRAAVILKTVLAVDPENEAARSNLARIEAELGRHQPR